MILEQMWCFLVLHNQLSFINWPFSSVHVTGSKTSRELSKWRHVVWTPKALPNAESAALSSLASTAAFVGHLTETLCAELATQFSLHICVSSMLRKYRKCLKVGKVLQMDHTGYFNNLLPRKEDKRVCPSGCKNVHMFGCLASIFLREFVSLF